MTPRGVLLSMDGTTAGESFCPGIERLQGSLTVLGWNDSRGVFCPGMELLQGSHSVLDETTSGESFFPGMERLQESHFVLGWNDPWGVNLYCDRTTAGESFCLR